MLYTSLKLIGRAPTAGPGRRGGAPGSSRDLAILNLEDGRYFVASLQDLYNTCVSVKLYVSGVHAGPRLRALG